jgi:hypothetical protein
VIGLALAGRERLEGWPRFAIEDVHRFAGMLVGAFVALHVLTIAIDSQAHFSFVQLVVRSRRATGRSGPGSASSRPSCSSRSLSPTTTASAFRIGSGVVSTT